ncbi:MAG: hypothetical protein CBD16_06930 [Betaproteobacteria bacterium TMED156]|nr:MAG: hypothetical protein CBD16_06930 [Betaproteobacteria bacterium TMED156]
MKILLYESLTAKHQTEVIKSDLKIPSSMLKMGLKMRRALEIDIAKNTNISLIIGKHGPEEDVKSYLNNIKTKIEGAWVVAPESKNELLNIQNILSDKIWIGSNRAAIATTTKKSTTKNTLLNYNILTPDSKKQHKATQKAYIVKPDDGAGTENTMRVNSFTAALNEQNKLNSIGQKAIIENFVEGQPMSFSMLCFKNSTEVLVINKQIIKIDNLGKCSYFGIKRAEKYLTNFLKIKIENIAENIRLAIPGLRGYVGVDFIVDENNDLCVLEVNPRITCSYIGLSKYLKRPLAREIINSCI